MKVLSEGATSGAFCDAIKHALVALVAIGHFIEPFVRSGTPGRWRWRTGCISFTPRRSNCLAHAILHVGARCARSSARTLGVARGQGMTSARSAAPAIGAGRARDSGVGCWWLPRHARARRMARRTDWCTVDWISSRGRVVQGARARERGRRRCESWVTHARAAAQQPAHAAGARAPRRGSRRCGSVALVFSAAPHFARWSAAVSAPIALRCAGARRRARQSPAAIGRSTTWVGDRVAAAAALAASARASRVIAAPSRAANTSAKNAGRASTRGMASVASAAPPSTRIGGGGGRGVRPRLCGGRWAATVDCGLAAHVPRASTTRSSSRSTAVSSTAGRPLGSAAAAAAAAAPHALRGRARARGARPPVHTASQRRSRATLFSRGRVQRASGRLWPRRRTARPRRRVATGGLDERELELLLELVATCKNGFRRVPSRRLARRSHDAR